MRQPYFGSKVALLTNIYLKKENKACIKNEEKQQVHASFQFFE